MKKMIITVFCLFVFANATKAVQPASVNSGFSMTKLITCSLLGVGCAVFSYNCLHPVCNLIKDYASNASTFHSTAHPIGNILGSSFAKAAAISYSALGVLSGYGSYRFFKAALNARMR